MFNQNYFSFHVNCMIASNTGDINLGIWTTNDLKWLCNSTLKLMTTELKRVVKLDLFGEKKSGLFYGCNKIKILGVVDVLKSPYPKLFLFWCKMLECRPVRSLWVGLKKKQVQIQVCQRRPTQCALKRHKWTGKKCKM